jgi:colanic acid/amylovoran biosynthesis glycosyltransferase
VRLLGAKSQDEVIGELRRSDILLAPSLAEALPVSLMEAHAMGLPVVATRVGSVDQIVREGCSGFLVEPGDAAALCRPLADLIRHPELRSEMGRRGRRHIERHYDIERLNDRLVEIYRELLEDPCA